MIELNFTRKAQKFYEQADPSLVRRLNRCFEQLRQDPYSRANIKNLKVYMLVIFAIEWVTGGSFIQLKKAAKRMQKIRVSLVKPVRSLPL